MQKLAGFKSQYGPSPWVKRGRERLFTMFLNYLELVTDVSRMPWKGGPNFSMVSSLAF